MFVLTVWVVKQNAHTAVTADQFRVKHYLVEYLRAEADVTKGAVSVPCFNYCNPLPLTGDRVEQVAGVLADFLGEF